VTVAVAVQKEKKTRDEPPLAHITFPLFSSADKVVETLEGGVIPEMGRLIEEADEDRSRRRANTNSKNSKNSESCMDVYNLTSTYTFSFNTMYIDLPLWNLVNIPGEQINKCECYISFFVLKVVVKQVAS